MPLPAPLSFFIGALGAALLEEIAVRGVLFRIIEQRLGTWIALRLCQEIVDRHWAALRLELQRRRRLRRQRQDLDASLIEILVCLTATVVFLSGTALRADLAFGGHPRTTNLGKAGMGMLEPESFVVRGAPTSNLY